MKIKLGTFLGFLCLGFLFSVVARAEEPALEQQPSAVTLAKECPEADLLQTQIKAKRSEIKIIEDKIKTLQNEQNAQQAAERIKKCSEVLMLNPIARARVGVAMANQKEEPLSPMALFLKQRGERLKAERGEPDE